MIVTLDCYLVGIATIYKVEHKAPNYWEILPAYIE
jgi:hypothetical protein